MDEETLRMCICTEAVQSSHDIRQEFYQKSKIEGYMRCWRYDSFMIPNGKTLSRTLHNLCLHQGEKICGAANYNTSSLCLSFHRQNGESGLTGSWSDVWHVNQRTGVLDEGRVMNRHTRAEALRVASLVELCVCHRDSGLVLTCKRQNGYYRKRLTNENLPILTTHPATLLHRHVTRHDNSLCLSLVLSPICLMPSLSSISSCTLGMSMCNRGPWGGPFTGVSKLRLFLLIQG